MSITEELMEWAEDNTLRDMELTTYPPQHVVHGVLETLLRIAGRIDAEHEAACAEAYGNGVMSVPIALDESAWVELPKGADGEYIHIGDVVENVICPSVHREVTGVGAECFYAWEDGFGRYSQFDAPNYRHHREPTVEDVLREFGKGWHERMVGPETFDIADYVEQYAAKLRLVGDAE